MLMLAVKRRHQNGRVEKPRCAPTNASFACAFGVGNVCEYNCATNAVKAPFQILLITQPIVSFIFFAKLEARLSIWLYSLIRFCISKLPSLS